MRKLGTIAIGGMTGTGKSTLANNVARESGGAILRAGPPGYGIDSGLDGWTYKGVWQRGIPRLMELGFDAPRRNDTVYTWFDRNYNSTRYDVENAWVQSGKNYVIDKLHELIEVSKKDAARNYDAIIFESVFIRLLDQWDADLRYATEAEHEHERKRSAFGRDGIWLGENGLDGDDLAYWPHNRDWKVGTGDRKLWLPHHVDRTLLTRHSDGGVSKKLNTQIVLADARDKGIIS